MTLSTDNELADSLFHADPLGHNELRQAGLRAHSDFLKGRCDDRCSIVRVMEFHARSSADKADLEHGNATGRGH